MTTYAPFAKPLYVMLKPVSSICNLACEYCYYLEKNNLYKRQDTHQRFTMSEELLEKFIEEYINAQTQSQVLFTWHGGEPFMRPLAFYKKAIALQKKYAKGRQIDNVIQTNGTLITPEWCTFLRENNWLVGVSIDGPQEFHDEFRRTRQGKPTFHKVVQGIRMMQEYGVEWNAMAVVNEFNADYPLDFYRFFKEMGCKYIQFTPVVERIVKHEDGRHLGCLADAGQGELADFSVSPEQWGKFACAVFDEWIKEDVGEIFVQLFDATLANWVGAEPGVCCLARDCGHASVMEYNGDVYSCDHFVFPEYKLGNIYRNTLVEMLYGEQQQQFGKIKQQSLPTQCKECNYLFACHGECPRNRFTKTATGEPGLNYLCQGYYAFFDHVAPYMDFMKQELQAQRPPSNVMEWARKNRR